MKKAFLYLLLTAFAISANAQEGFQPLPKGARYKIVTNNPGPKIKDGEVVTLILIQKNYKDSVLAGGPMQMQVKGTGDLMDVLPKMADKDSVCIKVPTDTIFAGNETNRPRFLPKGTDLNIYVKVLKVQSLEEAMAEAKIRQAKAEEEAKILAAKAETEESANLTKYIADNKLALTTTASGLKYKINQKGAGVKPIAGDSVFVNYTGKTLEGKVFDSSVEENAKAAGLQQPGRTYEPIAFIVGRGMVIPGWDEGLQLLNTGDKATLVIPSKLAYGANGAGQDIKPFSPLVFDVELVKVVKGPVVKPVATKKTTIAKPAAKKPATKTTTVKKTTTVTKKKQ